MATHCGLCSHEIEGNWEEHLAGEEHQANLKDDKSAWLMNTAQCIAWNRECDFLELCYKETPGLRELFIPRPPDYVDEGGKT